MNSFPTPAGFLADPPVDEQVGRMYSSDLEVQGYVANLTRVWAHSPETLGVLSRCFEAGKRDRREAILRARLGGEDHAQLRTFRLGPRRDHRIIIALASEKLGEAHCPGANCSPREDAASC